MNMIVVKGEPVAKGRPRFTRTGHTYTPPKTRRQEQQIREAYTGAQLDGPIEAEFTFIYEPPKSLSLKKKMDLMGQPKVTRPDTDNLVKLALDALNNVAYSDDNLIYKITSRKIYGPEAMTIIQLKEMTVNAKTL